MQTFGDTICRELDRLDTNLLICDKFVTNWKSLEQTPSNTVVGPQLKFTAFLTRERNVSLD